MEDINWDDIENLKDLIYNDEVLTEKKENNTMQYFLDSAMFVLNQKNLCEIQVTIIT